MLSSLMVEAAETGAVGHLVAAAAGAVVHVMIFEVLARGATGSRAAPPVAWIDLPAVPPGHGLGIVPYVDELLEHGQQPDPEGNGAVSPAAEESGEE